MPWDPTVESLVVAIHAALVPSSPTGEIVYFEGFFTAEAGRSFRYDCASAAVDELTFESEEDDAVGDINLFCAGHALLADGRWLVAGGWAIDAGVVAAHDHGHGGTGIRDCFVYLPRARTWRRVAYMHTQPNSELRGGGRWYPTLVTLGNGHVLAVGGHPRAGDDDLADNYPTPDTRRHSNNIPERYSPGANTWTELTEELTAPGPGTLDEYDRLHLAPSGHVFFSTIAKTHGDTRLFDPYTGKFATSGYGQHLDSAYDDANCSARTTSIILPILHGDPGHFWILTCGAAQAERIDLLAQEPGQPAWLAAGTRQTFPNNETPPVREHLLGILLPTGQVFVGCGMRPNITGVQSPEIYTPAIDWPSGQYTNGQGTWQTLSGNSDQATVPRGYHSVALLQPDGSVWTAGSTHNGADLTNPDGASRETRIEVFRPSYGGNRPTIEHAPDCVTYGEAFDIRMASGSSMARVAITRCGSFTHAFDGDQRYLTLPFTQDGDTLRATAPSSPNLAPPGYYLLWVLRNDNTPCGQARFVRLAPQSHYPVLQLSTYSLLAVKALRPPYTDDTEAVFPEAIELYYEGFLPHELDIPASVPDISWRFAGGGDVPGMRIELNRQDNEVDPVEHPDTSQRFRFIYDVVFDSEAAFGTFDDDETRDVEFRAELNGRSLMVLLTLMKKANPFMKDGDPPWLSTDLRIHKARVGDVDAVGGPQAYLQGLLDSFENAAAADETDTHPFDQLDDSQEQNPVVLAVPLNEDGTYNFAIARVRYLSIPGEDAEGVKVFFRLFNTVGTALEYDAERTYRTLDGVAGKIPGLGVQALHVTSIPFFAAPRVTPDSSMTAQHDNVVNRKTLFGQGPALEFRYFGCWLDVNTREKHFPRFPADDGPYGDGGIFDQVLEGPLQEMVTLVAGYHQCLVAEISYEDDPIQPRQTPFTTDNLAQRNLATVPVANPGVEDITRTAQTSVDIKPSDAPTNVLLQPLPIVGATAARFRADELVFSRNNLPPGTMVELFLPDTSIDDVLALSARRHGPALLERVDDHTLRFEISGARYVALPGGRDLNIPGLLSVTLPAGIASGQLYRLNVKQYSGRTLRFVGAFDLVIPVAHKADILPLEIEKLSLLRYIFAAKPKKDRWYPVFERYLHDIGERVRGFGGDPDAVRPSPHGTGHDDGPTKDDHDVCPDTGCMTGKICDVHYDCFGDFEGFVLEDCCDGRLVIRGSKDLERVVLMAWRERTRVTVYYQAAARDSHAHALSAADAECCVGETPAPSSPAAHDTTCPWSGRPAHRDYMVELAGGVVAFCSRAHRDRFLRAVKYFREVIRYVDAPAGGRPVQSPHAGHGQQPPAHHEHEHGPAVGDRPTHDHARTGRLEPNAVPSVNRRCPWTDKPVSASALTTFEGHTVGFHRPEDRDAFERALAAARPAARATSAHRDDDARHSQHNGKHHHAHPGKAAEHTHTSKAVRLVRLVMHC